MSQLECSSCLRGELDVLGGCRCAPEGTTEVVADKKIRQTGLVVDRRDCGMQKMRASHFVSRRGPDDLDSLG